MIEIPPSTLVKSNSVSASKRKQRSIAFWRLLRGVLFREKQSCVSRRAANQLSTNSIVFSSSLIKALAAVPKTPTILCAPKLNWSPKGKCPLPIFLVCSVLKKCHRKNSWLNRIGTRSRVITLDPWSSTSLRIYLNRANNHVLLSESSKTWLTTSHLLDTQVPLYCLGLNWSLMIKSKLTRSPLILGPGLGGVTITTAKATKAMTTPITRRAMAIPFQLRWLGVAATSS